MSWDVTAVYTILLVASMHPAISSEKCDASMSVEIPISHLLVNGTAWDHENMVAYPPDTYWIEGDKVYGCPCMLDRPCLRKCCPKDQAMDFKHLECIPHDEPYPWFRPKLASSTDGVRVASPHHFTILYGNFCWGYLLEPEVYEEDKFVIDFDNGSMLILHSSNAWLGPKDFCVDYFPEVDKYLPYVCFSNSKELGESELCNRLPYILYPIGMVISIAFLAASLLVYAILPKLRNLCGKCMMFYMGSLLCSYISLSTVQALGQALTSDVCMVFGFIIYISLLCTFFWLNVLCIDITLAFRSSQIIIGNPVERDRKKLIYYSLYAWGVPVLITIAALIAELHPGMRDSSYRPNFQLSCWFHEDSTRLIYFISPVGLIVFCNLCLFIYTAVNVHLINKKNEECQNKGEKRRCSKEDKKRLRVYVKLYVVMGVSWILEILSFVIGGSKCIWLFTDMINTLQGLFIFLILICNRKVIRQLRAKFCRKVASPDDPVTRLDESGGSSEDDLPTSSGSTDVDAGRGNNLRMKSKALPGGEALGSSSARNGVGDQRNTVDK